MSVFLRRATADDLAAVGALHHRSRVDAYRDIVPADALAAVPPGAMGAWWIERWSWERHSHVLTVAERDGALAGFTYVGPYEQDEPGLGELYAIHLDPDEVGRGVGRLLMIDALATLRERGWSRAALWVLAGNTRARRFYERGGWVADGVERDDRIGAAVTRMVRYSRPL
ncbi:L-amino acid N-acyltransferase YncA [Micromonospora pattaloongensis]|uniref:L-amino acid N-acyltransferase YncA n=1 Tax=Micromonospora pattaloongensis TaxID=405436 RepID=A0A1H3MAZ2_9ACTN|nr:GNAT family N-acetyltransferase [Micromonospora pattaloongensis]SDY73175.1 L-amino acid N-acyltransferase YncA [Micromonospora pattaloongensis]